MIRIRGSDSRTLRKLSGAAVWVCAGMHAFVLLMHSIYIKPFIQGTKPKRESANCLKAQRGNHSYPYLSIGRVLPTSIRWHRLSITKTDFLAPHRPVILSDRQIVRSANKGPVEIMLSQCILSVHKVDSDVSWENVNLTTTTSNGHSVAYPCSPPLPSTDRTTRCFHGA